MEASVIEAPKQIRIVSAPLPEPEMEEVLVKFGWHRRLCFQSSSLGRQALV
jgi:hypothetical protein